MKLRRLSILVLALALTGALASSAPAAVKLVKIYYNSPGPDNGNNASLNGVGTSAASAT